MARIARRGWYIQGMASVCPICGKAAGRRAENPSAPFCSARCKQVDLGKWLREEYRIGADPVSTQNEPADASSNGDLAAGNRKEPPS